MRRSQGNLAAGLFHDPGNLVRFGCHDHSVRQFHVPNPSRYSDHERLAGEKL
jgi:hypothetical protein